MTTVVGDLLVLIRGDNKSLLGALQQTVPALKAVDVAVAGTVGVFAGLTAASVAAAVEYDRAFDRIEALSNANAEAVGEWRDEVLTLAGETAQAPQELADALFFLSSAGLDTADVMGVLEKAAQASAVGLGSTVDIAKITAAAMNAYAKSGLTAAEVTDTLVAAVKAGSAEPEEFAAALGRILPIASKAGVEFDEVTASLAGLSNIGLDVNEGVTAMRGLLSSMVAPTQQTQDAMDELGISTDQLRSVLADGGLLAAMQLLEERSGGNLDILKALVPNVRSLTGQLGLTGDNAKQVASIFDQVANSSGSLSEALRTTEESVGFRFDQLKATLQATAIEAGEKLLPALEEILPVLTDLVEIIGAGLSTALGVASRAIIPFTDLLEGVRDEMSATNSESNGFLGNLLGNVGVQAFENFGGSAVLASQALGNYAQNLHVAEEAADAFHEAQNEAAFAGIEGDLRAIEGLWDSYVDSVDGATEAEKRHAEALGLSLSAMRQAAGGLLGLIEAARNYATAQDEVAKLERQGKKGSEEYADAVDALITERIELTAAVGDLQREWKAEGISLDEAKEALTRVGRQAGLAGEDLKRFIREGLKPVRDELEGLKRQADQFDGKSIDITLRMDTSQFESKIAGLQARYGLDFGPGGATIPTGSTGGTGGTGGGGTATRRRERIVIDRRQNSDALSFEERYGPN